MRAKFLRKEKSKYWGYDYYFECIDCGEEYTSMRFDDRTTPYCGKCWRKHSLERKKIREKQKKQAEINEALDMIINTIRTYYTGDGSRNDGLDIAIRVIEDYKEWKNEGVS